MRVSRTGDVTHNAAGEFDAVLVEARRRGCAVLATYEAGHFTGWRLVPWTP